MDTFNKKLRLIFLPFLLIAVSAIAGYTFLHWLLFIRFELFPLKEEVLNFWIPFAIPWIPLLLWLRPRVRLLDLKRKKGDRFFAYIFIAALAVTIPTVIAQEYLVTASGKLSQLDHIGQIDRQEASRYYTLKHFYIDKMNAGVYSSVNLSGKYDENYNMNIFIVLPVLSKAEDTAGNACKAWYGVKYHEQISNHLDEKEKGSRWDAFARQSQEDFDKLNVDQFIYLKREGLTDNYEGYTKAIKENRKYSARSQSVLIPVNEPFEARNGNMFEWIFISLGIGTLVWFLMLLVTKFSTEAEDLKPDKAENKKEALAAMAFLSPHEGFFITPIVMYVNVIVFLLMVMAGIGFMSIGSEDLLRWGGNFRPSVLKGEWWRLLTSTFLHGGLMHLLANMYGLFFVGLFLEPRIGRFRYAMAYLLTGIIASLASLWWHEAIVSVGASGAIFGMYGVFLTLLLTGVFPKAMRKNFLMNTMIFVGGNLAIGISGGIDNAAHTGGLLSGILLGLLFTPQLKKHRRKTQVQELTQEAVLS